MESFRMLAGDGINLRAAQAAVEVDFVIAASSFVSFSNWARNTMRTTPLSFYGLFVVPNYWDYRAKPHDARLGFNAAVSAFQLADIFFAFYRREDPEVIRRWKEPKNLHLHLSAIEPYF